MDIHFVYFEDCPSHAKGLKRLRAVLHDLEIDTDISVVKIETEEQAHAWKFTGSPTILINGQDIVTPPPEAQYALTCRTYFLPDGRISPLPSAQMIRSALQRAQQT
ncbi:MAG: DUF2703 domain-containing protein [Chloroflexi bacterium]|nr:DUF2703 domain-containing protein [Chloroflexota bacterium]